MLCLVLMGCGGKFELTESGVYLYQNESQQFSCKGAQCCYPWKNRAMVCTSAQVDGINTESGRIFIRIVPENH